MKLFANLVEITSTKIGQYPGDNSGDSIIATLKGSAGKGETAQVHGQVGIIANPAKSTKQVRIRIGSLDILISSLNYKVPLPTNPGDSKVYSTDADGNEQATHYLDDTGKHTFNSGILEAARNTDPVKSTIVEDPAFWGWATRYNTFNTAWIAALATLQSSGGSPAGVVTYATAMQVLLATLGTIPLELTGKITAGTNEVLLQ